MTHLSQENFKEIAEQLECGFECYVHKNTHEIIPIPDFSNHYGMDKSLWKDDIKKINKNPGAYVQISVPSARFSYSIMENFIDQLKDNNPLKNLLLKAISARKPFQNFKQIIDQDDFRQAWFDFRIAEYKEYVVNEMSEFNIIDYFEEE